jgi:genome maintenance exonuclease 1
VRALKETATRICEPLAAAGLWPDYLEAAFQFNMLYSASPVTAKVAVAMKQLENWLEHGELKTCGNMVHLQAAKMAQLIIDDYLKPDLQEWWASEASLYHTGLYAGTTDLVGIYNGKPSIIDFKQTNKPKKTEWIDDYFLQGAAYSQAHNHLFGTDIAQIVVLMCSKDLEPQRWIIKADEFDHWTEQWWVRVTEYYLSN